MLKPTTFMSLYFDKTPPKFQWGFTPAHSQQAPLNFATVATT